MANAYATTASASPVDYIPFQPSWLKHPSRDAWAFLSSYPSHLHGTLCCLKVKKHFHKVVERIGTKNTHAACKYNALFALNIDSLNSPIDMPFQRKNCHPLSTALSFNLEPNFQKNNCANIVAILAIMRYSLVAQIQHAWHCS
jgi:hypothetical protein